MIALDTDVLAIYHILCLSRIQKGIRLGDAVILWTLETSDNIDAIITWNSKHFKGKTFLNVLTPPEFL